MSTASLRCTDIVRIYTSRTGETHALRGVDATFHAGSVTAVVGPSGSGKSSLLQILALRQRPTGGELSVLGSPAVGLDGRAARRLRRRSLAWVPQQASTGLFPHISAIDHVTQIAGVRGVPVQPDAVLDRFGLLERRHGVTAQLSGGEQQRLTVAMAVIGHPAVVVADEPTAELDDSSAAVVLSELASSADRGSCVVVTTHDPRAVAAADRVLLLRHGVLSSDQGRGGRTYTVIDSTGRLQLSPEDMALFPGGRALVRREGTGLSVLPIPPEEGGR